MSSQRHLLSNFLAAKPTANPQRPLNKPGKGNSQPEYSNEEYGQIYVASLNEKHLLIG